MFTSLMGEIRALGEQIGNIDKQRSGEKEERKEEEDEGDRSPPKVNDQTFQVNEVQDEDSDREKQSV